MKILIALACAASPAFAEVCPPAPDHSEAYARIYADLRTSRGAAEAQALSGELWELWLDAPDEVAQRMLDQGMALRQGGDFPLAAEVFDTLITYCPDYAEGYNQRAFANYLSRNFEAALTDLDRALEIAPRHLGALSGKGLTLMGLGRNEEAQQVFRDAVRLNPWMAERALIEGPLETDI